MSELPWDRFGPDPEELPYHQPSPEIFVPTPEPPPVSEPPPSVPAALPSSEVDVKALAKDVAHEILDYVKETGQAVWAGQEVDIAHPTVTATTATGRELVVADARNRSLRTLVQGLIFDLFAAFLAVVATLSGADPFQKETWITFGVLLVKSFISAGISYLMRINVTPTIKAPDGERAQIQPLLTPIPAKEETTFRDNVGRHEAA